MYNLRKLAEAATPGAWEWGWRQDDEQAPGSVFVWDRPGIATAIAMCPRYAKDTFAKDAAYIAAANPTTVLAMLEEMGALREEIARLHAQIQTLKTSPSRR